MLQLQEITKIYTSCNRGIENISLSLPRGEIVGIFGENGAGKSTLMKSTFGFHSYEGKITLDGENITQKNITKLSFATCEHSFFPRIDSQAHKDFYQRHFPTFRENRFDNLMEFFDLPKTEKITNFSTGQKNQFEVILALSQGADYIFMDEPFAGNDIFNREDFYKVLLGILEEQETVVLSTHLIEEVSNFIGRAILLSKGKLIADTYMEDLEEKGLMAYVKEAYHYKNDRVSRALEEFQEKKEEKG